MNKRNILLTMLLLGLASGLMAIHFDIRNDTGNQISVWASFADRHYCQENPKTLKAGFHKNAISFDRNKQGYLYWYVAGDKGFYRSWNLKNPWEIRIKPHGKYEVTGRKGLIKDKKAWPKEASSFFANVPYKVWQDGYRRNKILELME